MCSLVFLLFFLIETLLFKVEIFEIDEVLLFWFFKFFFLYLFVDNFLVFFLSLIFLDFFIFLLFKLFLIILLSEEVCDELEVLIVFVFCLLLGNFVC